MCNCELVKWNLVISSTRIGEDLKTFAVVAITVFLSAWAPCATRADTASSHHRSLPLLVDKFEKYGYEAPLPFGASLGVMFASQDFVMDKIRIDGEPIEAFAIGSARGTNMMLMPKVDMWLLPFLDLYVFGGLMTGTMNINVILYDLPVIGDRNLPLEFDFDGGMLGGGATFAGGYKWLFAMFDGNYSKVNLSTFESKLDMTMASARLGVATKGTGWQAMFWAGGMYQNMDQTLQGLHQLEVGGAQALVEVDVGVKDDWNMVVGSRLQAGRRLALLIEGGFIGRRQLFTNIEYRF